MMVNIFDGTTQELRSTCELSEAIPDPKEFIFAKGMLELAGHYWTGGGAAPLVYIKPVVK